MPRPQSGDRYGGARHSQADSQLRLVAARRAQAQAARYVHALQKLEPHGAEARASQGCHDQAVSCVELVFLVKITFSSSIMDIM